MTPEDFPHGKEIVRGEVKALRREPDILHEVEDPREVRFSKRYSEGRISVVLTDEFLQDAAVDPWQFAEGRLDAAARRQGGHHRDGSPV